MQKTTSKLVSKCVPLHSLSLCRPDPGGISRLRYQLISSEGKYLYIPVAVLAGPRRPGNGQVDSEYSHVICPACPSTVLHPHQPMQNDCQKHTKLKVRVCSIHA